MTLTRTLILVLFLTFCFSLTALAADDIFITIPESDRATMQDVWSKFGDNGAKLNVVLKSNSNSNLKTDDTRLFIYDTSSGTLTFSDSVFLASTRESSKKAIALFIDELYQSRVSEHTKDFIISTLSNHSSDLSYLLDPMITDRSSAQAYTDAYLTMRYLNPIVEPVRVVLGVFVILIFIFLTLSSVTDLACMALPFAREFMEARSKKTGRYLFISSAAADAIRKVESSIGSLDYRNVYLEYFKKRILFYIIFSIFLTVMITGGISDIISWLLETYFS